MIQTIEKRIEEILLNNPEDSGAGFALAVSKLTTLYHQLLSERLEHNHQNNHSAYRYCPGCTTAERERLIGVLEKAHGELLVHEDTDEEHCVYYELLATLNKEKD